MAFDALLPRGIAAGSLVVACAWTGNASASFTPGDVYLVSASLDSGGGGTVPGIFRIPSVGAPGTWITLPNGSFGPGTVVSAGGATYDPHRDRILVTLVNGGQLGTVDSTGTLGTIPVPVADWWVAAPGPNGIVYLVGSQQIAYIDTGDVVHPLLDPGGNPIAIGSLGLFTVSSGIYDSGTGTLIVAGVNSIKTRFARIPLNAGGTQASATPDAVERDLIANIGETVLGMSAGPAGSIFVSIDINASGSYPLLQTIDPVTFAPTTFATMSGFNDAGMTTGAWVRETGLGLALDTANDLVRAYSPGSTGTGVIVATGASSTGGSGEAARMISIGTTINGPVPVPGDLDGDGHVGAADLAILLGAWGPCADCASCPADLDGDCGVGAADLAILLGDWG